MLRNKLHVYNDEPVLIPADLNYGAQVLRKFRQYGDMVALIDPKTDEKWTYSKVAQVVVDTALSLRHMGVRKGEVVGLACDNKLPYFPVAFGIICAGAVYTYMDYSGKDMIEYRAKLVKPRVIFCSRECYSTFEDSLKVGGCTKFVVFGENQGDAMSFESFLSAHPHEAVEDRVEQFIPVDVQGSDIAAIVYTSGTTGEPRAVPLTHLNMLVVMENFAVPKYFFKKPVYVIWTFERLYMSSLYHGAMVLCTLPGDIELVLKTIEKYKITTAQLLPPLLYNIANWPGCEKYDLSSLECILHCCNPLIPSVYEAFVQKFPYLKDAFRGNYGSSETGIVSSEMLSSTLKLYSTGTVYPGVEVKISDLNTGETLGRNQTGEIRVRAPSVYPGFIGDTKKSHLDEDGFCKTEDVGYFDDDEYLYVVGRTRDLIKYQGYAIAPTMLEDALSRHPSVFEAGVVGVTRNDMGEAAVAMVVLKPGVPSTEQLEKELHEFVAKQVPVWMKIGGGIHFVDKLPRGARAKLDRKAMRKMLENDVKDTPVIKP